MLFDISPNPFTDADMTQKPAKKDPLKEGLSERKPLFEGYGDSRVPQTPRTVTIPSHGNSNTTEEY